VLDVGYVDIGPPGGRAVLLLHGWPYDIHSYADVAPALAAAGYRVIVPYLRGYGVTRFRSDDVARNGQQAVLAVYAIALMDALGVGQAIVAGFDWGARTANVMAALWPERCRAMVSVSGYLIDSQAAGQAPCCRKPSGRGGTSTTSRPSAAAPATRHIAMTSPGSSGAMRRRRGASTVPRSSAARPRSTIPTAHQRGQRHRQRPRRRHRISWGLAARRLGQGEPLAQQHRQVVLN